MRIITENNTENYIHSLAFAIDKDPSSMETWRCLHITPKEEKPLMCSNETLQKLKEIHQDIDCDIVLCSDNDIMFISNSLHSEQLYEIAAELVNAVRGDEEVKVEMMIYDLFRDWNTIHDVLLSKTGEASLPIVRHVPHNFGEISSLQEVFADAKKRRKSRMPLHVMLVEDDPLTRRLVTNTFKENYALITAANAEEAIAGYLLHAPDIVFLDINLPDASGLSVLGQIMESDPEAYVVMFSGNSYLDNITTSLGTGASGFIAKPFKKDRMHHYIKESALHHSKQCA